MSSLLGLPREIRDEIITFVLCSQKEPPEYQGDTSSVDGFDNTGAEYADFRCQSWSTGGLLRHSTDSNTYTINASGLLLVNRQLRAETLKVASKSLNYSLDMFLLNEIQLLPTWTCIPLLSQQAASVTATLRYQGHPSGRRSGFRGGCCGPPPLVWSFYILLERFVKVGPIGPMKVEKVKNRKVFRKAVDRNICIKTLHIDIRTPHDFPENCELDPWPPTDESRERKRRARYHDAPVNPGKYWVMHPEEVLGFLQSYLSTLLSMCYHTAEFGALMYERVGTIEMSLDGEMREVWNLEEMLAAFPAEGPYQSFQKGRQAHFPTWRRETLDMRQKSGLPVIRPQAEAQK
ncbi:hypothetical protein LTS18_003065 [Coniosporium uncinatum]|uniref:Uncharacterized protein n=1 Tax=Coniosporium uncinatum TaxID=93489 RepID=A0ACC3DUA8_9PEZI|nr:hypothetical protein LTS18_003065 [Coniosporium uncinatum]